VAMQRWNPLYTFVAISLAISAAFASTSPSAVTAQSGNQYKTWNTSVVRLHMIWWGGPFGPVWVFADWYGTASVSYTPNQPQYSHLNGYAHQTRTVISYPTLPLSASAHSQIYNGLGSLRWSAFGNMGYPCVFDPTWVAQICGSRSVSIWINPNPGYINFYGGMASTSQEYSNWSGTTVSVQGSGSVPSPRNWP
jgi:hypothetical protein